MARKGEMGEDTMRTHIAVLTAAITVMIAAPSGAHVVQLGTAAKAEQAKQTRCGDTRYTIREYRSYASKVYKRKTVSKKAHRRLRKLHRCQRNYQARKKVGRSHTKYIKARIARRNPYPPISAADAAWLRRVRYCESGSHGLYRANTGNGFYGAYQFTLSSWRAVGGGGYPHLASPAEQDYRALRLRALQGRGAWPNCG